MTKDLAAVRIRRGFDRLATCCAFPAWLLCAIAAQTSIAEWWKSAADPIGWRWSFGFFAAALAIRWGLQAIGWMVAGFAPDETEYLEEQKEARSTPVLKEEPKP